MSENYDEYEEFQFDFSDTDTIDTEIEEDAPPLGWYDYEKYHARAGSVVHMDGFSYRHRDLPDYQKYSTIVKHAMSLNEDTFRNLVVTIEYGATGEYRNISLSRRRLLEHGGDIFEGFDNVLENLIHQEIQELYDHYEAAGARYQQTYGVSMNDFQLSTKRFHVVYDQPNYPAGGSVVNRLYTQYLDVEDVPNYYGESNCIFACFSFILKKRFNVAHCRRIIKLPEGPVAIRHIKRFERASKINIDVYTDAVDEYGRPIVL